MVLDTRCVVYNKLDEAGAHLFLKCKAITKVWDLLGMDSVRDLLISDASAGEVTEMIMAMKEDQRALCCILLWTCWTKRNRNREGELGRDPVWVAHSIQVTMDEWRQQERQPTGANPGQAKKWEKPEGDSVKANCEAAFKQKIGNYNTPNF